MSNAIQTIANIDFNGLKWITILRNKLCENGDLNEDDIKEAFGHILSDDVYNIKADIPEFSNSSIAKKKSLFKLRDNKNVNGLHNNEEITFSPFFTLLYGQNGTGKTSYYKILKDAFHSNQSIRRNIYSSTNETISAKIDFINSKEFKKQQRKGSINNFPNSISSFVWKPGARLNNSVKFCDKGILQSSLQEKETGWSVDKYKLGYFKKLQRAIDKVESEINNKTRLLKNIITDTTTSILNALLHDSSDSLKQSLSDSKFDLKSLKKVLKEALKKELPDKVEELKTDLDRKIGRGVSDLNDSIELERQTEINSKDIVTFLNERIDVLRSLPEIFKKIEKKIDLEEKRDFSAFKKYELLFPFTEEKELSDTFINLLKNISETALKFGHKKYPENIDKCFYCNQELPEESKELISNLHDIVENEYQKRIDKISHEINAFRKTISQLKTRKYSKTKEFVFRRVNDLYDIDSRKEINLSKCLNDCLGNDYLNKIEKYLDSDSEKEEINKNYHLTLIKFSKVCLENESRRALQRKSELEKELNEIERIRKEAQYKLNKIKDIEYLKRSKDTIKKLIDDIDLLLKYRGRKSEFQGLRTKVTKSKSKFESKEIWSSYKKKFNGYLNEFNIPGSDKIKRNFTNPSGKSHIDTQIKVKKETYPTREILSEGEAKIHALCDFLTELEFDDVETLVFDDPITSLDHRYIKMFSKVLVELSNRYQVIVFTHSMEFYQELVTKSLGNGAVENPKCGICKLDDSHKSGDHCHGFKNSDGMVYKCGNYYQLETGIQPGIVKDEIDFLRMNYEQRLSKIKNKLKKGDISDVSLMLRTTINNFYEHYVLGNIKQVVFKGEDLLNHKDNIRVIEFQDKDYDDLKKLHSDLSGRTAIHETSIQNKTPLDLKGLITIYNELIEIIQKYQSNVGSKIVVQQST